MIPPPMNDMESSNAMPSICDSYWKKAEVADMNDVSCPHVSYEGIIGLAVRNVGSSQETSEGC
jgi:hypothetical protein